MVGGTMSTEDFHSRGREIGLQTGNINLFSTSELHTATTPSVLNYARDAGEFRDSYWEGCHEGIQRAHPATLYRAFNRFSIRR